MRIRPDGPERFFWQSKQMDGEQNPEEMLSALLSSLMSSLKRIAEDDTVKISAQIVVWQAEEDDMRGFYVGTDLVNRLAALHADLDIDVVRDLR